MTTPRSTRLNLETLEARDVPASVTGKTFTDSFTGSNSVHVGTY